MPFAQFTGQVGRGPGLTACCRWAILLLVLSGGWTHAASAEASPQDPPLARHPPRSVPDAGGGMGEGLKPVAAIPEADDAWDSAHANDPGSVTYENRMYGFALTYDGDEWEDVTADDDLYDQLFLFNGISLVGVFTDPDYSAFPLHYCVADYAESLKEADGASEVTQRYGWQATGATAGRAWATFAYALTDDDGTESHLVRYFECRLIGDELTLVITQDVPAEALQEEIPARTALLAGLHVPETRAAVHLWSEGRAVAWTALVVATLFGLWIGREVAARRRGELLPNALLGRARCPGRGPR